MCDSNTEKLGARTATGTGSLQRWWSWPSVLWNGFLVFIEVLLDSDSEFECLRFGKIRNHLSFGFPDHFHCEIFEEIRTRALGAVKRPLNQSSVFDKARMLRVCSTLPHLSEAMHKHEHHWTNIDAESEFRENDKGHMQPRCILDLEFRSLRTRSPKLECITKLLQRHPDANDLRLMDRLGWVSWRVFSP